MKSSGLAFVAGQCKDGRTEQIVGRPAGVVSPFVAENVGPGSCLFQKPDGVIGTVPLDVASQQGVVVKDGEVVCRGER